MITAILFTDLTLPFYGQNVLSSSICFQDIFEVKQKTLDALYVPSACLVLILGVCLDRLSLKMFMDGTHGCAKCWYGPYNILNDIL